MTHYYDAEQQSDEDPEDNLVSLSTDTFFVTTDNGVFAKDGLHQATEHLIESATPKGRFSDLGCEYGVIRVAGAPGPPRAGPKTWPAGTGGPARRGPAAPQASTPSSLKRTKERSVSHVTPSPDTTWTAPFESATDTMQSTKPLLTSCATRRSPLGRTSGKDSSMKHPRI